MIRVAILQSLPNSVVAEVQAAVDKHAQAAPEGTSGQAQRVSIPSSQLLSPALPGMKSTLLSAGLVYGLGFRV